MRQELFNLKKMSQMQMVNTPSINPTAPPQSFPRNNNQQLRGRTKWPHPPAIENPQFNFPTPSDEAAEGNLNLFRAKNPLTQPNGSPLQVQSPEEELIGDSTSSDFAPDIENEDVPRWKKVREKKELKPGENALVNQAISEGANNLVTQFWQTFKDQIQQLIREYERIPVKERRMWERAPRAESPLWKQYISQGVQDFFSGTSDSSRTRQSLSPWISFMSSLGILPHKEMLKDILTNKENSTAYKTMLQMISSKDGSLWDAVISYTQDQSFAGDRGSFDSLNNARGEDKEQQDYISEDTRLVKDTGLTLEPEANIVSLNQIVQSFVTNPENTEKISKKAQELKYDNDIVEKAVRDAFLGMNTEKSDAAYWKQFFAENPDFLPDTDQAVSWKILLDNPEYQQQCLAVLDNLALSGNEQLKKFVEKLALQYLAQKNDLENNVGKGNYKSQLKEIDNIGKMVYHSLYADYLKQKEDYLKQEKNTPKSEALDRAKNALMAKARNALMYYAKTRAIMKAIPDLFGGGYDSIDENGKATRITLKNKVENGINKLVMIRNNETEEITYENITGTISPQAWVPQFIQMAEKFEPESLLRQNRFKKIPDESVYAPGTNTIDEGRKKQIMDFREGQQIYVDQEAAKYPPDPKDRLAGWRKAEGTLLTNKLESLGMTPEQLGELVSGKKDPKVSETVKKLANGVPTKYSGQLMETIAKKLNVDLYDIYVPSPEYDPMNTSDVYTLGENITYTFNYAADILVDHMREASKRKVKDFDPTSMFLYVGMMRPQANVTADDPAYTPTAKRVFELIGDKMVYLRRKPNPNSKRPGKAPRDLYNLKDETFDKDGKPTIPNEEALNGRKPKRGEDYIPKRPKMKVVRGPNGEWVWPERHQELQKQQIPHWTKSNTHARDAFLRYLESMFRLENPISTVKLSRSLKDNVKDAMVNRFFKEIA